MPVPIIHLTALAEGIHCVVPLDDLMAIKLPSPGYASNAAEACAAVV